jgi:hypothetical protein
MDIGFDRETLRQALAARGHRTAPDWRILRARLEAAQATRHILAIVAAPGAAPSGSFDPASARAISGYAQGTPSVNPTALGNGKPSEGISAAVAVESLAGGRGT